jgi:protein involved in polysaccharide export with SLBB domain
MVSRIVPFAGRARCLLLLTGLVLVGACSQQSPVTPLATTNGTSNLGGTSESARIHRLGIGDKVKITVFGEADLSGQYEVGANGILSLPLIGEIPAKNSSIGDVREAISRKLRTGYLKNPKVSVEILSYRPFYVHGEVRGSGEFAFKNGVTIRDAIAIAGGYTYRANLDYVLLIREGTAQEVRVNLPSIYGVMPGDNIRIPERFF